jgi:hypothetical protein
VPSERRRDAAHPASRALVALHTELRDQQFRQTGDKLSLCDWKLLCLMSLLQLVYASFLHVRANKTDINGEESSIIFSTLIAARQKLKFLESLV